jgi:hypothetical protein
MPVEMGTGGNFKDELDLIVDEVSEKAFVDARGPVYGTIHDICAWVVQRQGANDAAATQITTIPGKGGFEPKDADGMWKLRLNPASTAMLGPGDAFAFAIGLFLEDGQEKVRYWAQSVKLVLKQPQEKPETEEGAPE